MHSALRLALAFVLALAFGAPLCGVVSSATARNDYTGTGSTATYPYTFLIYANTDIAVIKTVIATGVETTLVLTTDYTVTGVGTTTGGNVVLVAGNLPATYTLTIKRAQPFTQLTDLRNQGAFRAEDVGKMVDRSTMQAQTLKDRSDRSLQLPESEAGSAAKTTLPASTTRASKFFAWDASGYPLAAAGAAGSPTTAFMATVLDDADSASARTTLGGVLPSVATVAALRALAGTDLAGYVRVLGYYAAGDGGGGTFVYSASAGTENGGTVIIPTGGVGNWARLDTDTLDVKWFGAKSDGSSHALSTLFANLAAAQVVYPFATSTANEVDWAAIQAAVNASAANNNRTVILPHGRGNYIVNGLITITQGTMIEAPGSQGSATGRGTVIEHRSNGGLFLWNGNGTAFMGTGGGLKNVLLLKATTFSGGDCIKVLATDDNHRPGEMLFENVLSYGTSGGLWTRGLHIDGTACVTPGAKGVRSVVCIKCRFADCSVAGEYVKLNQVTHFSSHHLAVDQGGGATAGMTLMGDSENVSFMALDCSGNVFVNDNAIHVHIVGRCTGLDVEGTGVNGIACVSGTAGLALVNKSPDFKVVCEKTDGFFAYLTAAKATLTGDGTSADVNAYDVVGFNQNVSFNASAGEITILCSGVYHFDAQVTYSNLGAAHTRTDTIITQRDSSLTVLNQLIAIANPYACSAGGNYSVKVSGILRCSYGDKVRLIANVSGGAKTVDVYGAAGTGRHTYFSAKLLP